MFQWESTISWLGGTDTPPLLVSNQIVLSFGMIIPVEVFPLALSHYFQNPESASNVVYSLIYSSPIEVDTI